jgi:hypothetical protein
MSTTKGTPKIEQKHHEEAGCQQQQDPSNSRNRRKANNSIILNTVGKSATERRQATAGNPGVVDTGVKFATGVIGTGGK